MADASDAAAAAPQADLARAQREITDKRGYSFAEFEWLAEKDPAYEKARLDYASMIYTPENPALPVKYREIIAAVILAFRGHPTLDRHVRRALREGRRCRRSSRPSRWRPCRAACRSCTSRCRT